MSIQLYIGHSGQRLQLDPSITTVEALKAWVNQHASIQPRAQILLTSQGKQVRAQTLHTENELFVFDSKLFASRDPANLPPAPFTSNISPYIAGSPPDTIANQNDLQAWQNLFRLRKSWASALLSGCSKLSKQAEQLLDEETVIGRSLSVAVASLQQHIKSGEKKYGTVEAWAHEILQDQDTHLQGWEHNLDSLRAIPAKAEFVRFVQATTPTTRRLSQQGNSVTLQGFVDIPQVRKAAATVTRVTDGLSERLNALHQKLETAAHNSDELLRAVNEINTTCRSYSEGESEPAQLQNEIEVVVKKIGSDLEHVMSLPRNSQSVSQASKMAVLHTRNYLPNLGGYCVEMNELIERVKQRREQAALSALEHMRTLSGIESQLADLYAGIESFGLADEDQGVFAIISTISRLPSVYGQLLVESVRRREWVAKMKRDSAALQEEMATYQEEEEKRRRRWMRAVEDVVNADALLSSRVLGIELSLQNEGGSWPMVTRQELQEYLDTLLQIYGDGPVTEEIDQAIKDLDKPTRKQLKHAKAFKNGSMHEAAFGDTSLLLRGDEQFKSLRDINTGLEEELKGQKSRVRKLEDLLHRSTQASRASMGDIFTPQSLSGHNNTPPPMPTVQNSSSLSRNGSVKQRRPSFTQALEEKKLARRVVDLEAELHAARQEVTSRKSSDVEAQKQAEEAISTKKDLMENMEAQQREFANERRTLESDLREARYRTEELEGEIERLLGSRDDERTGTDTRVAGLEDEIARLREDAAGHAARAANEHDARSTMERKLEVAERARATAEEEIQRMKLDNEAREEAEAEHTEHLASAHAQLSSEGEAPSSVAGLAAALEELARRSAVHVKDLAEAVAFARSENESLRSNNEAQKSELTSAAEKLSDAEDQTRRLQEQYSAEEARAASLEQQLKDEQDQLRTLREKFADGETGSEVLRQRVAEEETKAGKLATDLAESQSHISSLDIEIKGLQDKHKAYQATAEESAARLDKRAERSKELSQRLHTQNARLGRLLERIGLAISYQNDSMVVERASKLGASTIINDPRGEMNRTVSLTSPPPTRRSSGSTDAVDISALRWPDAQSPEDETAQFEAFLQHISRFNLDTFSDAVVKRLRDFEYTAKKYNKEAKESTKRADAYKERSLRSKTEAQAKIAVKDFKEGDLALFLPTRGQAKGAWAAFNVGCPHYFLAEREGMRLGSRDFIVARISKVEQKVVDLSKSIQSQQAADGRSLDETSEAPSFDDDNPFELSDGLTWWMVHATEERGIGVGAPTTPGLGKSTVAAANVDAKGSIRIKRSSKGDDASKHLNKSLDSRRSSSNSKKSAPGTTGPMLGGSPNVRPRSESQTSLRPAPVPTGTSNLDGTRSVSSGLGIVTPAPAAATVAQLDQSSHARNEQKGRGNSILPRLSSDGASQSSVLAAPPMTRPRSQSPSKSIRSLRQHLDSSSGSPAKASPSKQGGRQAWESLWSAEFSVESPSKGKKT